MRKFTQSYDIPTISKGPLRANERLVFMHLFKTAGTTVHNALAKNFQENEICPERFNGLGFWPHEQLAQFRFFSSHTMMVGIASIPGPIKVVTFLREPKARLLSHYEYLVAISDEIVNERNVLSARYPKLHGFKKWLASDSHVINDVFRNLQTVFLAGNRLFSPAGHLWRDEEEMLDAAISNLDNLTVFGLAEYMHQSMDDICRELDIFNFYSDETLNPTPVDKHVVAAEISLMEAEDQDEILELIDQATALDQRLYAYARNKFKASRPDLSRRYTNFQSLDGKIRHGYDKSYYYLNGTGLLLYGPYTRISAGKYKAVFTFLVERADWQAAPETDFLRVEVCRCDVALIVFGTAVVSTAAVTIGAMREVEVEFSLLRVESNIEFRMFVEKPCGIRAFCSVKLLESSEHL